MNIVDSVLQLYLDVYVQSDTQDPNTGAIKKQWNYSQTVPCSAKGVISNSSASRSSDKQVIGARYQNENTVQIRTSGKLNIRHKVTNIRDRKGNAIWTELDYPSDTPTVFEIIGVTPIVDPFGVIIGYNSIAKRSENQIIGE
jgi:hypothetical protein